MNIVRKIARSSWMIAGGLLSVLGVNMTSANDQCMPTTPVTRDVEWWVSRFAAVNERVKQGDADLIFVGDSITQGWEGAGKKVWAKYYSYRKAVNLGFSGDRTEHVLWRLDNGNIDGLSPKVAVVMIGTNNSPVAACSGGQIGEGIKAVVDKLRERLPKTKILLLGVFPRGHKPNDLRDKNTVANKIVAGLDDGRMVHYMDIGEAFLDDDGTLPKKIMPDYLHLSEQGYEIWAEQIETKLAELLGEMQPSWHRDELGETGFFPIKSAPYPHGSRDNGFSNHGRHFPRDPHYVDSTVAMFIPAGYKPSDRVDVVLYFHGHGNCVRRSFEKFRLLEQFVAAGKNAILVFPEGPKNAGDSGGGRLEEPGAFKNLLDEVLATLKAEKKIESDALGEVSIAGHSGAYRVISFCLEHGGIGKNIVSVGLLDASYDRLDVFSKWIESNPRCRFFSIYTKHLADENKQIKMSLKESGVEFVQLDDKADGSALAANRVTFLATKKLSHSETVQWFEAWLRSGNAVAR